jgi:hypothetical protein
MDGPAPIPTTDEELFRLYTIFCDEADAYLLRHTHDDEVYRHSVRQLLTRKSRGEFLRHFRSLDATRQELYERRLRAGYEAALQHDDETTRAEEQAFANRGTVADRPKPANRIKDFFAV